MVAEEKDATTSSLILDSLEVKGFRGFRHLQIEKLGRVNLIVGKNGVGKTALLESLLLYIRRGSPFEISKMLLSRDEGDMLPTQRMTVGKIDNNMMALKHLFYGRKDIREDLEAIEIGPIARQNNKNGRLSISIGRYVSKTYPNSDTYFEPIEERDDMSVYSFLGLRILMGNLVNSIYRLDTMTIDTIRKKDPLSSCVFVPAYRENRIEVGNLWDSIHITELEVEVINAIRIIAPSVERLGLVVTASNGPQTERIPIVKVTRFDEPIPLRSLGEGMNRLFGIALALVNAKGGMLLIDEVESGLHYSVQPDVWKLIFETAARLNVQVFATTHSWDCIEAFQKAAKESDEEGLMIRLAEKKGEIIADVFGEKELEIATRENIELR